MSFQVLSMPGMTEYCARLAAKHIKISDEMLALACASARTPSYGLTKVLSKCGYVSSLVVPNPEIIDIDEERTDEETGSKLTTSAYLLAIRARYQVAFYMASHPEADAPVALLGDRKDSSIAGKLTDQEINKIVFLMRWNYMAYAMVSPPDCPTFPLFLFYKGDSNKRGSDRSSIDNYEPVSLDALEFFHYKESTDTMLAADVSTIALFEQAVDVETEDAASVVPVKFPLYDPRYPVYILRRSGIGRDLSNIVDPEKRAKRAEKSQQKQAPAPKEGDTAAAAEDPMHVVSPAESEAAPKTDKRRSRTKKPEPVPEDKEGATAAAAAADDDPMDVDVTEFTPEEQFRFDCIDDLARLDVPRMQRDDLAINCIWVDRAAMTGHTATPTIAELDSLCRLYVKRDDAPSYPGDLAVRFLLTIVGKHNPGVTLQAFVNVSTKALAETPAIGSMDINQLAHVLKPDIIHAAKEHVMRTALAEETLRLAHNQHDIATAKAAAAAAAAGSA